MKRYYVLNGSVIFERSEFEAFLINHIHEHKLYDLRGLLGDGAISVELHVKHHPFRLAKEIFGARNVTTFEK